MQDTGRQRSQLDQFYTSPGVARACVDILRRWVEGSRVWIEPSAGTGAFLDIVPDAIGYDIDPKHPRIHSANFLEVDVPEGSVVYGNPPFGRQGSLAKAFIAHASRAASVIGFILPRSFTKPSMQKTFPPTFHLVDSLELPPNSFVVNDRPYDVPCVFQVWKRKDTPREVCRVSIHLNLITSYGLTTRKWFLGFLNRQTNIHSRQTQRDLAVSPSQRLRNF